MQNLSDKMQVKCYDEDWLTDEVVGEAQIEATILCEKISTRKWLPLKYNGKKSAMILLETKYSPPLESWPDVGIPVHKN